MQNKKKKNLIKMKGNKNLHMMIMNIMIIQKILKINIIIMYENKIYLYLYKIKYIYIYIYLKSMNFIQINNIIIFWLINKTLDKNNFNFLINSRF